VGSPIIYFTKTMQGVVAGGSIPLGSAGMQLAGKDSKIGLCVSTTVVYVSNSLLISINPSGYNRSGGQCNWAKVSMPSRH